MIIRFNQSDFNKLFDVIIIGGGINGCGIARDAASRGLSVLLLEKNDFAYGCTSGSTRLIHGGLRYLEYFDFDLVRESLHERELLLKNAPHLVKPLEIFIPTYRNIGRPSWEIAVGMILYDILSFDKSLPVHKHLSKDNLLHLIPKLNSLNLTGGFSYFDCQVAFPERICIENILMAKSSGAKVLNHTEVIKFNLKKNKITSIEFLDKLSNQKFAVCGKEIINVSGPWVDNVCSKLKLPIKQKLNVTKGSHLILRLHDGPKSAIYSTARADGRPFFIIPWNDYYLVGTTDIFYKGDLDDLIISKEEINYLLSETQDILPGLNISHENILYSYCGIRPLPYVKSLNENAVTRRHIIFDHSSEGIENFISIIGGKLTTYRMLSEIVVDKLYKKLNYSKQPCRTHLEPLIGRLDLKSINNSLSDEITSRLINLYGNQYSKILCLSNASIPISKSSNHLLTEFSYVIKNEDAYTISDVLLRRTMIGFNSDLGENIISPLANILKSHYNFSTEEIDSQINDYTEHVIKKRKHFPD